MNNDRKSFNIQLYSADDGSAFHVKDEPGELQRPHIIDDLCSGLTLQADMADVIHGKLSPDGNPSTLIIVIFRFLGQGRTRRFREAEIKLRFSDEKKPYVEDPEVYKIAPEGSFTLHQTALKNEWTKVLDGSLSCGITGSTAGVSGKLEKKTSVELTDCATLTGARRIEGRNFGKKNVVRFNLFENRSQKDGIVSELRAAVLLNCKNDSHRFVAHAEMEAVVDMRYKMYNIVRKLAGKSPENDPVVFDANCAPTRTDIDRNNLGSVDLDYLSDVVSTTVLCTDRSAVVHKEA